MPPPPESHPPRAVQRPISAPLSSHPVDSDPRQTELARCLLGEARPGSILTVEAPLALSHPLEGSLASEAQLSSVLSDFQRAPYGARYAPDGCYARAQLLANEMHGRGLTSAKLFVRPTRGHLLFDGGTYGRVKWTFHVAPLAFVRQDAGITARVLDPGLEVARPLSIGDWLSRFDARRPVSLSLTDSTQYSGWKRASTRPKEGAELWPHALEHAHRVSILLDHAHERGVGAVPLELVVL